MPKFANMRQVILKQKRGTKCPFLRRFVSLAVKQGSNETFVPSEEIFEDYCQTVAVWTDGDSLHGQTKYLIKKAAFYKQLKKELEHFALSNNWDVRSAVQSGKIRGYSGIQLQRPRRRPALEFGGRVMLQRLQHYMGENPKPDPPIELHDVPSDPRGAGTCAFASRDIEKCEIICEYEGERISLDEAQRREALYRDQGRPCTLMVIESGALQIAIDPYEGNPRSSLTWGSTMNHSLNHANVKPFIINKHSNNPRVFLVALHDIAQTTELLWNYNDEQCQFYSNSQTLPEEDWVTTLSRNATDQYSHRHKYSKPLRPICNKVCCLPWNNFSSLMVPTVLARPKWRITHLQVVLVFQDGGQTEIPTMGQRSLSYSILESVGNKGFVFALSLPVQPHTE